MENPLGKVISHNSGSNKVTQVIESVFKGEIEFTHKDKE